MDGNVLGTHIAVIHTTFLFPEVGVESCHRAKLCVLGSQIKELYPDLSSSHSVLRISYPMSLQNMQQIVGMDEESRSRRDCLPGVSCGFVFLPKQRNSHLEPSLIAALLFKVSIN